MIEYKVQVLNERTEWQFNGVRHRIDGPAVEWTNGTKWWFLNSLLHRESGPAVEWANGAKWWYKNGQLHRESGPAVEYADGHKTWWLNGREVTQADVMKPVKQLTVAQIEVLLGHKIKVVAG